MLQSRRLLWVPVVLIACASAGKDAAAPEPKRAKPFAVKQPFPTEKELAAVTAKPAAAPDVGEAPASLDRWEMADPLPTKTARVPYSGEDPLLRKAAEGIEAQGQGYHVTDGMMCYAREYARFAASHESGALPVDIDAFMRARCGATVAGARARVWRIPAALPPRELVGDPEMHARFVEGAPQGSALGIAWADAGDERVVVVAAGTHQVEIEPVPMTPGDDGAVIVRGQVAWPYEWLTAEFTQGALGYGSCSPIPHDAGRARFAFRCPVDAKDSLAFIELLAAENGALLGRRILTLVVSPDGSLPTEYSVPGYSLPVDETDLRPEGIVAAVNSLRSRAKQEPLSLSSEQSQIVQTLLPYLYGETDVDTRNLVALGIMAGWKVEGAIRSANFEIQSVNEEWTLDRLAGGGLASPKFRSTVLDPAADVVAIGTLTNDATGGRKVLCATYDLFVPRSFAPEEQAFFDELDRQRASVGQPPVVRVQGPNDKQTLHESAERIRKGESAPDEELQGLVNHFAGEVHRDFQGMLFTPMRLEGWRPDFPDDLFTTKDVAVAAEISYFRPIGTAWGQHVVLMVWTKLDGPMR